MRRWLNDPSKEYKKWLFVQRKRISVFCLTVSMVVHKKILWIKLSLLMRVFPPNPCPRLVDGLKCGWIWYRRQLGDDCSLFPEVSCAQTNERRQSFECSLAESPECGNFKIPASWDICRQFSHIYWYLIFTCKQMFHWCDKHWVYKKYF